MTTDDRIVAVDIGSTKIVAVIGEANIDNDFEIIGVGSVYSKGINSGTIVNIDDVASSVKKAIEIAEDEAGVSIRNIVINITGSHITGINSRGVVSVSGRKGFVTHEDINKVHEQSAALRLPYDRDILHVISKEYTVDDQEGILEPLGLAISDILAADVHIITVSQTVLDNLLGSIRCLNLDIDSQMVSILASAESVLHKDEKDLGSLVMDIGGGTLDVILYRNGYPIYTKIYDYSADYITKDISKVFKTSLLEAENVKLTMGCCYMPLCDDNDEILLPQVGENRSINIQRKDLCEVIQYRMEELLEMVYNDLLSDNLLGKIESGIVITGGGSLLTGIIELSSQIFKKSVRIGYPEKIRGLKPEYRNPKYAAVLGMVKYYTENGVSKKNRNSKSGNSSSNIFDKIKDLFQNFI